MKKLTLDLDKLEVETFDTSDRPSDGGTVRGFESEGEGTYLCSRPNQYTCMAGCIQTQYGPGETCYWACTGPTYCMTACATGGCYCGL